MDNHTLYCRKCGAQLRSDEKFCYKCGIEMISLDDDNETKDTVSNDDIIKQEKHMNILGKSTIERNSRIIFLFLLIIVLCAGFGISTDETIPDNAIVYTRNGEYYGEPTMKTFKHSWLDTVMENAGVKSEFKKTTLTQARQAGYKPDKKSRENGDFIGESRSLMVYLLQRIGVIPATPRWNKDGTWNY